jgi:hypothetical protein
MPQNAEYMYAAYAVIAAVFLVYTASLWRRSRTLARRAAELDGARGEQR